MSCTGPGGSIEASATVTVTPPPVPTVSLSASPASVTAGGAATLAWTSTDATECTASGGWSGTKSPSGNESTGALSEAQTFGLSCTGPGGAATANRTVTVIASDVPRRVLASVETQPVTHSGDAADDPAIWINPSDPALSTIIGTDKQGGLDVYDLSGTRLQHLAHGNMNNVDIRSGFSLGGQTVDLVTAGNRSNNTLAIYRVDPVSRLLVSVNARTISTGTMYGSCMYRSPTSGKYYFFQNNQSGVVKQWELFATAAAKVDAVQVRTFDVGTQTEGCVADDVAGQFYIGEEQRGIWRYGAEPTAGTARVLIDSVGSGKLSGQVEGLTIAYGQNGTGYLMASSQGNGSFVIYDRQTGAYVRTFSIVSGPSIDGTTGTDGIDVTTANLGGAFPNGVFVAQDGSNSGGNQNFKLVPLNLILAMNGKRNSLVKRVVAVTLAMFIVV